MMSIPCAPYESDPELKPWRTNLPLPEWTETRIRALAVNTQRELNDLDNEIFKARTLLDGLLTQHTQKTDRLSFLRGAVLPLKRLPPEILGKIFIHVSQGRPAVLPPDCYHYPWVLGQVSSHWRKVLWNTPDVWSNLEVGSIWSENDPTIDIAMDIFSRTNISFSLSTNTEVGLNNPVGPFILGHVNRLRHLNVEPTHDFLFTFLDLPQDSLDALESIVMRFNKVWNVIPGFQTTALHTARRLTRVIFRLVGELTKECPSDILHLPWGQLTDISLINLRLPYDSVHSILNECHCLITCSLAIGNAYRRVDPPSNDVVLPTLLSFTIVVEEHVDLNWDAFLRPLVLPLLKNLDISLADHLTDDSLISLLKRSRCHLKTLIWAIKEVRECVPDEIYALFHPLNSVRELIIPSHCLPPAIFEALSQNQTLPELKRIVCRVNPPGFQAFADLVEHCIQQSSRRIESAVVGCWGKPGFDEAFDRYCDANPKWVKDGRAIQLLYLELHREDDYEYSDTDGDDDSVDDDG
jgi:hypothetical protein